jgi:hypothetical protein
MPPRITHSFHQDYSNWDQGSIFADFYQHQATLDIIANLDEIDMMVITDNDLTLATELIDHARK